MTLESAEILKLALNTFIEKESKVKVFYMNKCSNERLYTVSLSGGMYTLESCQNARLVDSIALFVGEIISIKLSHGVPEIRIAL